MLLVSQVFLWMRYVTLPSKDAGHCSTTEVEPFVLLTNVGCGIGISTSAETKIKGN